MAQVYAPIMKQPEYREGPEARATFERGMKVLFKVPKADIVQPSLRNTTPLASMNRRSYSGGC